MSDVMLDNWGLSDCAWWHLERETGEREDIELRRIRQRYYAENPMRKKDHDICWQNMLTSLVLWDHIYINLHSTSYSADFLEMRSFVNVMEKLTGNTDIFKVASVDVSHINYANVWKYVRAYEEILQEQRHTPYYDLLLRGIQYLLKANMMGFDYIPHPRRAAFLQQAGVFSKGFDRTRYLDILDEEVLKYMDELNELAGHQPTMVQFPVLYRFIEANASTSKEELKVALELRENKNVKAFRKSLDKIQKDYSEGNMLSVVSSLKETKDICNTIAGEMYRHPLSFNVTLGFSPSVDVNVDLPKRIRGKLHTTFLYDLAHFALKGNTKRKYNL